MTRRSAREKASGTGCMVPFFGVFAAFSLLFLTVVTWMVVLPQYRANTRYVEHECIVLDKRIGASQGEDGMTYRPEILIRYTVNGRDQETWTYDVLGMYSSGRTGKQEILDGYEVGQNYRCWYDPEDPSKAVLVRGYHWSLTLFLGIPLIFLAIGIGGIIATLCAGRNPLRIETSRASRAGHLPRGSAAVLPEQGEAETPNDRRARYPFVPEVTSELGSGRTLSYQLSEDSSARFTVLGLLLFAVIWNGITSVFVVIAIRSHLVGKPEWFLTIFIIPFVLIGLFIIGGFIRAFLIKVGVPKTAVEVSAHPLLPGQSCEFLVRQPGPLTLNALMVALVCEESARYRQGTSTRTEDRKVFETEVYRNEGFEVRREFPFEGQGTLQIPEGAMHSFEGGNNKVDWKLIVKGDVPGWPNYERSFPILVLPEIGPEEHHD